jgi:hypothetical protein
MAFAPPVALATRDAVGPTCQSVPHPRVSGGFDMAFAVFMASPLGRGLRIVVGALLIYVGLSVVQGVGGTVLAVFGILPLITGMLNLCVLAPLLGAPFRGSALSKPAPPRA